MKLHSDIINKDFDQKVEEVDIVEEDLDEILPKLVLSIFMINLRIKMWKVLIRNAISDHIVISPHTISPQANSPHTKIPTKTNSPHTKFPHFFKTDKKCYTYMIHMSVTQECCI